MRKHKFRKILDALSFSISWLLNSNLWLQWSKIPQMLIKNPINSRKKPTYLGGVFIIKLFWRIIQDNFIIFQVVPIIVQSAMCIWRTMVWAALWHRVTVICMAWRRRTLNQTWGCAAAAVVNLSGADTHSKLRPILVFLIFKCVFCLMEKLIMSWKCSLIVFL